MQAHAHDDRPCDDGREVLHYVLAAPGLAHQRQNQVHETRAGYADAGVHETLLLGVAGRHGSVFDHGVAAQEREGGAEEHGDLPAGDEVHEQRGNAGEQQRRRNAQPGDDRHQHRGAEHGEQVLKAQHQHFGRTQGTGVVDRLVAHIFFGHSFFLLSFILLVLFRRWKRRSPRRSPSGARPRSPAGRWGYSCPRSPA